MKNWLYISIITFAVVAFAACSEDDETRELTPVSSIELANVEGNTISLEETDTFTVEAVLNPENAGTASLYKSFSYSSGDASVFTVTNTGVVTAVNVGSAVLTITSGSGSYRLEKKCMVKVTHKVSSIEVPERFLKLTLGTGYKFDANEIYRVVPDNYPDVTITSSDNTVVSIYKGVITGMSEGSAKITIASTVRPEINAVLDVTVKDATNITFDYFDRTGWKAYGSQPGFKDDAVKGDDPVYLIDDDDATCFVMNKPGKNNSPADADLYVVLDMQSARQFDAFRIDHRKSNTQASLRVWSVSIYGSDEFNSETMEGDFQLIQTAIETSGSENGVPLFTEVPLAVTAGYRYVKIHYDSWNESTSNTIQVAEIYLGTAKW